MFAKRFPGRLTAALLIGGMAGGAAAAELAPGPYLKPYVAYVDADVRLDGGNGSRDFGPDGEAFGLGLGYLAPLGQGAFGVELHYGADDARAEGPLTPGQSEDSSARRVFQGDHSYGVSVMLGGFVARKVLFYAIGGWEWYRLENTSVDDAGNRSTSASTYDGPVAGLGAAIPLYGHRLSLRLDAKRAFLDESGDVDPERDLFSVGLAWVF